ncbi:MAG: hypothetical protein ABSA58_16060 [Acetobacteraceae bacterium]
MSGLLNSGHLRDVLAAAIADAKREARANGLTNEDIDTELCYPSKPKEGAHGSP